MSEKRLEIASYDELEALLAVILEGKFSEDPIEKAVSGSPALCAVLHRLVAALKAWDVERYGEHVAERWSAWAAIDPTRREWRAALARVEDLPGWSSWPYEKQRRCAELLVAPFRLSENLLDQFLSEASRAVERAGRPQ